MAKTELLTHTVSTLERLGIPYMLSGSLVSSFQGEPRSTHDIDIVIDLRSMHIDDLIADFPEDQFFLSASAVEEAVRLQGMFNVIDITGDGKVDFWLLTHDPFDQSRFARRLREDFSGTSLWISSPEDTIVMKLRWSHESGGSARHFRDALRVYEVQASQLDMKYIEHWSKALSLGDQWTRLLAEANPL